MINEANSAPTHSDMITIVARELTKAEYQTATEHTLPNGKRADVVYVTVFGNIHIVEVKSDLRPYYLTGALAKYGQFAHYMWLAAPKGDPGFRLPDFYTVGFEGRHQLVGLISVDWHGLAIIRPARLLSGPPLNAQLTIDRVRNPVATGERLSAL